ncbi:hypothetical protein, partial [Streptomyces clavuligerus]
ERVDVAVDAAVTGGGQSRPATARALPGREPGPVVPEASGRAVGSWPRSCDSLTPNSPRGAGRAAARAARRPAARAGVTPRPLIRYMST